MEPGEDDREGDEDDGEPPVQQIELTLPPPGNWTSEGRGRKKKCVVMCCNQDSCASVLPLLTVQALGLDGRPVPVNLLIDTGSNTSFIKVGTLQLLSHDITGTSLNLNLHHLGGQRGLQGTSAARLQIYISENNLMYIQAYALHKILSFEPFERRDGDFPDLAPGPRGSEVDLLLGVQDALSVVTRVVRKGTQRALDTVWGLVPCGGLPCVKAETTCQAAYLEELSAALERLWKVEEMPMDHVKGLTRDEALAVDMIEQNLRYNADRSRFETTLLFRNKPDLLNNYDRALARFRQLERKLSKNPELGVAYQKAIQEYIDLGVVDKIEDPAAEDQGRSDLYYLPHRAVYDPDKVSTKCRIVFDASAQTASGKSLNDHLMPGPPLQLDIVGLALRFRVRPIVLVGDIAKMFLNIDVRAEDRDFLRFLWKEPGSQGRPSVYRFSTLIFGATDSPFQAITCLQKLVAEVMAKPQVTEREKRACQVILRDTYVDDISTGGESVDAVRELMVDVQELLKPGHFLVKKWKTNSAVLLASIPEEDRAPTCEVRIEVDPWASEIEPLTVSSPSKMLGVGWDPEADVLKFRYDHLVQLNDDTKTAVASLFAKIYDPLGLVSPFVLKARSVMKATHVVKLAWKDKLTPEILEPWRRWVDQCVLLSTLAFPRHVPVTKETELHVFADASVEGYGYAAYLRRPVGHEFESHLLMARSRVSPIKEQTIPRLELMAALLAAQAASDVAKELVIETGQVHCWSDSEIVLYWLKKDPRQLIPFVANRIEKIQQYGYGFAHVQTEHNPADLASRGCDALELAAPLWIHGPEYLRLPKDKWPKQKTNLEVEDPRLGVKRQCVFNFSAFALSVDFPEEGLREVLLEDYCSSFTELLRRVATLMRFAHHWKIRTWGVGLNLALGTEPDWMTLAETWVIREVQEEAFPNEVHALKQERPLPVKSKLRPLTPWLDELGVMRVGGRLAHATLTQEVKHPIVLPKEGNLVTLLVRENHLRHLHAGTDWLHQHLREKYWILSSRQVIRAVIHRCVGCARQTAPFAQQQMAQLPEPRVNRQPPFTHVGVDFAGHLAFDEGDEQVKGALLVFTCLTTRAIHLELTHSADAEDFILALKRMSNSKGTPSDLYSDNARTFKKAKQALQNPRAAINVEIWPHGLPMIRWHFSTEAAPHTGGVWERMVQLVKRPLVKTLRRARLSCVELETLCKEVEGMVNDRPLAEMSADSMDAVTPSMLLLGRRLRAAPEVLEAEVPRPDVAGQWQARNDLMEKLWEAWTRQYCNTLQRMGKWNTTRPNLQVGDLVIVRLEIKKRHQWPMARVTGLHPGPDGLTRKVSLLLPEPGERPARGPTRTREIVRSVHHVIPLEMTRDCEQDVGAVTDTPAEESE